MTDSRGQKPQALLTGRGPGKCQVLREKDTNTLGPRATALVATRTEYPNTEACSEVLMEADTA